MDARSEESQKGGAPPSGDQVGRAQMHVDVVRHAVIGPPHHGVTRYGRGLLVAARTVEAADAAGHRLRHVDLETASPGRADLLHVPFTDRIFGATLDAAVDSVRHLLDREAPRSWVVNLHDLPQREEGADRYSRRAAAYAWLAARADVVVANSQHEARGVHDLPGCADVNIRVIPLPLEPVAAPGTGRRAPDGEPLRGGDPPTPADIGLLGFVYPGKGYERLIDAAPVGTCVRAIGQAAEGHHDYLHDLMERARQRGVDFEVTGYVPEGMLAAQLHAVNVPVCPHRHVSASGSLNTWIAHGRVPLVLESPYMIEIAHRWPGAVTVATAQDFRSRLLECLGDPRRTRALGAPPSWGWSEVAAAYSRVWAEELS